MRAFKKLTMLTTAILLSFGAGATWIACGGNETAAVSESSFSQTESSSIEETSLSSESVLTSDESEVKAPLPLAVGENLICGTDKEGEQYTFTATEEGYYAFHSLASSSQGSAYISYLVDNQLRYLDESLFVLRLDKNETLTFTAFAHTDGGSSLDLSITRVAVAGAPFTLPLIDGEGSVSFYALEEGEYSIDVTEGARAVAWKDEILDFVTVHSIVGEAGELVKLTVKSDSLTTATLLFSLIENNEEESPKTPSVATLGENVATLSQGASADFTFTADETCTFILETTNENGLISWATADRLQFGSATKGNASEVTLAAGEGITITVFTINDRADTVAFTIKQAENRPALTEGANTLQIVNSDNENTVAYTFTATEDSNYTLYSYNACSPYAETLTASISYEIDGERKWVDDTQTLLSLKAGEVVAFSVQVYDESLFVEGAYTIDLTITRVILADEQATVTFIDGEATLCFYPLEAGRYVFDLSEGAQVMVFSAAAWGYVAVEYLNVNQVNDIVYITIKSDTLERATITLSKQETDER